ncbi:MAG: hypothetical protein ACP5QH_07320 [Thermoplasmata archaeon]
MPLIEEGYLIEELKCKDYKLKRSDLSRYFDFIAVKQGIVRLVKFSNRPTDDAKELQSLGIEDPSVEIWHVHPGHSTSIYKLIEGRFYRLRVRFEFYPRHAVRRVTRYILWGMKGIVILTTYEAHFIPSEDLYENFSVKVEPYISKRIWIHRDGSIEVPKPEK